MATDSPVDHGVFAKKMGKLIDKHILDRDFCRWVIPDFTTTVASL